MTNSSENNTQENQLEENNAQELDMSKIWSYIRCYFYVIFGYHFLFLVEESTGEKFYNVWSGYIIITSILLMLVLYFCKGESVNSFLSFCKDKLKYIYSIILFVFLIIYISNVCSIRDFLNDFFKAISFLELNDLGDFLSGVFAPLAFVFLYLSYKQLQQQLKIANETLEEQKEQAKESEEHLKQKIEIEKERLQLESLPVLYISSSSEKNLHNFALYNKGETIINVSIWGKKDSEKIRELIFLGKENNMGLTKGHFMNNAPELLVDSFIINHPELSEKVKDNIYKIKLYIKFETKLYTCYQVMVDFYYKKIDDKKIEYYTANLYKPEVIEE